MATNVVDREIIEFGTDLTGVQKGLGNLAQLLQGGLKNVVSQAILPLAGAFAGLFGGQFVQDFANELETTDRLSKSLRMSVEELNDWRNASRMAGAGAEEMTGFLKGLQGQMRNTAMTMSGPLANWARRGVLPSVIATNGALKDTNSYLLEVADRLHNLPADKAAIVAREIGLGNDAMREFISLGSEEIKQKLDRANRLAGIQERDVKIARAMLNVTRELAIAIKGLLLPIFRVITPVITKVVDFSILLIEHWRALIPVIVGIATVISTMLMPTFAKFGVMLLKNPITWFVAVLLGLGLVLEDFITWLEGGESSLGEFFKKFEGIKWFEEFKQAILDLINMDWGNIDWSKVFSWNGLKTGFEWLKTFVVGIFRFIIEATEENLPMLQKYLTEMWMPNISEILNGWQQGFEVLKQWFANKWNSLWDNINLPEFNWDKVFGGLGKWIDKFSWLKSAISFFSQEEQETQKTPYSQNAVSPSTINNSGGNSNVTATANVTINGDITDNQRQQGTKMAKELMQDMTESNNNLAQNCKGSYSV